MMARIAAWAPDVVVLDVQYELGGTPSAQLYAAGHLPGAAPVDLDSVLARRRAASA